jgi:hypothetical protein
MPSTVNEASTRNSAAVALLYDNLAALPATDGGLINMLPFAHDSEQTREIKQMVAKAIINLLDTNGHIKHDQPKTQPSVQQVKLQCMACRTSMVETVTNEFGVANVDARLFIAGVAGLNPECPHAALTLDDMRRKMERELLKEAEEAEGEQ